MASSRRTAAGRGRGATAPNPVVARAAAAVRVPRRLEYAVAGCEPGKGRTAKAVAGAGCIDRLYVESGNAFAARAVAHERAVRPELQKHGLRAQTVRPVDHRVRRRRVRSGRARPRCSERSSPPCAAAAPITARARASGHSFRRRFESNEIFAPAARAASNAASTASQARRGDGHADARCVDEARRADQVERQILGPHAARSRAGAQIAEDVALRPVGDEIHRRCGACGSTATPLVSTPSAFHSARNMRPNSSSPMRVTYAVRAPCARRGDDHVRAVAAEALQVVRLARPGLVEFDHRLADGHDVEGAHAEAESRCRKRRACAIARASSPATSAG